MTNRSDLTPTDEELAPGFERLLKVFEPKADDLTVFVLKAHVLFEELLRDFLAKQFRHPQAIQGARLSFAQILKLAQAFAITLEPEDWRWKALVELNRLRNSIAHEFEAESSDSIVSKIIAIIGPEAGADFPRLDRAPKHLDTGATSSETFAMALAYLYAVFAVRLGFDVNVRLIADREQADRVFAALRKESNAS